MKTQKLKESETSEFKKSTSELKEAIISIVGILNKHQKGKIIFGIKPNGEIVGQSISEKTLRDISQQISAKIEPKIFPKIYERKIKMITFYGKTIRDKNESPKFTTRKITYKTNKKAGVKKHRPKSRK